jgi:membrane protein required for colicin V production
MWYDVVTLCILIFATIRGAMKGIVWQLAVIASLVFCFFFSGSLSTAIAPMIRVEPPLNRWIAMFILYLGFSFVSFGVARILEGMIEQVKFEEYDRHLGAVLGLLKGSTFSIFLTFFLLTLSARSRESVLNSESGYAAAVIMDRLDGVMPRELYDVLDPYIRRLDSLERPGNRHEERELRRGGREEIADDRRDGARTIADERREIGRPVDETRPAPRNGADPFMDADPDQRPRRDRGDRLEPVADGRGLDERLPPRRIRDEPPRDSLDTDSSLPDWLSTLQGLDEGLKQLVRKAWRNTRAEHQPEFKRLLTTSVPEAIREIIRRWENGRPAEEADDGGYTSSRPADRRWDERRPARRREISSDRSSLEREIARATVDRDGDPRSAIDDIEASLQGVPEDVALNVLRDWRADLRGDGSDPDPDTTIRTRLNTRIVRQLQQAGISTRSLDTALQDRLRSELR